MLSRIVGALHRSVGVCDVGAPAAFGDFTAVGLEAAGGVAPAGVETVAAGALLMSAGLGLGGGVLVADALETGGSGGDGAGGLGGAGAGVTADAVVTAAGPVAVPAEAEPALAVATVSAAATETAGPDAAATATPVANAVSWRRT